ncbi:MAG TPA: nitrile hydratase accessory protein, partial [Myxococcota bacterium]|nr:nitrile hydratase accessory protein [Myxococcota bacterium]
MTDAASAGRHPALGLATHVGGTLLASLAALAVTAAALVTLLHLAPGDALAAIPAGERNPTFAEPWQAQAFAITLALHRQGLFTWNEWASTLGHEIKAAQAQGD